jgi:hypothetical protein
MPRSTEILLALNPGLYLFNPRNDGMYSKELTWEQVSKLRAIATLRVNVKSLAAEAKFIRKELTRSRKEIHSYLTTHRKVYVRQEARITQLALAAVRGRPYGVTELNAKTEPDWGRVWKKVCKHLVYGSKGTEKWFQEAKDYFQVPLSL